MLLYGLLLAIIYIAFISLGLPDSLLGAGWPAMNQDLQVPLSYAGILTMIVASGTILSSLQSSRFTSRFGVNRVTAVSVFLTAFALLGFSLSSSFYMLCIFAIPYGIGAGAVDAALNNYVAIHYSSKHMNWLHASWGVGASISPYIMSFSLALNAGWASAYFMVAMIQFVLATAIWFSFPLWKLKHKKTQHQEEHSEHLRLFDTLKIHGVKYILVTFFAYCALESTTGLWTASFLVNVRAVSLETAASFTSLFFIGITLGRFFSGFIAPRLGDKNMIRFGISIILVGILGVLLPIKQDFIALSGFIVIGLGCAPIYPAIIHSTPANFGAKHSPSIVGVQMASAYMGTTFIPPLFGVLATSIGLHIFPFYLLIFALMMLVFSEALQRLLKYKT